MTRDDLAVKLNGREIGDEVTPEINDEAAAANLVIVFSSSDDLCGLEGAIRDEFDCYDGGEALIDRKGLVPDEEAFLEDAQTDAEKVAYYQRRMKAVTLEAVWGSDISWTYNFSVPHATFDIMEDGEVFCRGIVFNQADLP